MNEVRLKVIAGPDEGRETSLLDKPFTIGRGPGNALMLSDSTVSRQHIKLFVAEDQPVVVDMNSTHGTTVNGELITRRELKEGDVIAIGQTRIQVCLKTAAEEAAGRVEPLREGFELEVPELPRTVDPAVLASPQTFKPAPVAPGQGLTGEGEDPFAIENAPTFEMPEIRLRGAPPISVKEGSQPVAPQGVVRIPPAPGGGFSHVSLFRQDLGQHPFWLRAFALLLALAAAIALGIGAMQLVGRWTRSEAEGVDPAPAPQAPLRSPPR